MIGMTNAGGGGLALNVVAYASVDVRPTTAPENTIAVITDTPITGYVLSPTQPKALLEGMVWVQSAGPGPEIEASGGRLILLVGTVRQYISGQWRSRERAVYQNGAWSDASSGLIVLFDNGDECSALTGGWVTSGKARKKNSGGTMALSIPTGSSGQGVVKTGKEIDLGEAKKLYCNVSVLDVTFGNTAELQVIKSGSPPQSTALKQGWNEVSLTPGKATIGFKLAMGSGRNLSISIANADGKPGIYLE